VDDALTCAQQATSHLGYFFVLLVDECDEQYPYGEPRRDSDPDFGYRGP
jgi:hypothetical protein